MQLPGAVQDVGRILGLGGLIDFGFRFPEHGPELDAPVGEALPQNLQQPHHLHFPAKALHDLPLTVGTIDFLKPFPRFGLADTDEGDKGTNVQGLLPVKGLGAPLLISTLCGQVFLNVLFKALFFYVEVGHVFTSSHFPKTNFSPVHIIS